MRLKLDDDGRVTWPWLRIRRISSYTAIRVSEAIITAAVIVLCVLTIGRLGKRLDLAE